MPDDVARILQFILDAPTGFVSSTALREFIGDRAHQRIESLESMGFIEVSSYDVSDDGDVRVSAYEITPCGRDSLAAFHKQQHERACEEAEGIENYEYLIINDDLEECVREMHDIIGAARRNPARNRQLIADMRSGLEAIVKGE